jgi:hypothetical protein
MLRRAVYPLVICGIATQACRGPSVPSPVPAASRQITYSFAIHEPPDSASVEVYVPPSVDTVRAVIAFIARSVDQYAFDDRDWRGMCGRASCALLRIQIPGLGTPAYEPLLIKNAAAGGGDALLAAMRAAALETAHPEILKAKLIVFGHSAAGSFVVTFANRHPDRVLGLIRYHSIPVAAAIDTNTLTSIPVLTIVGGRDRTVGLADSRALWQAMRFRDAPWAYVSHVGQAHFSVDGLIEAGPLMRDWIEGVLSRSVSDSRNAMLNPPRETGWLVDDSTGEIAPAEAFRGGKAQSSWLPNAAAAFELKALAGACKSASSSVAVQLLGTTARLVSETVNNCHYSADSGESRDLFLAIASADNPSLALARVRSAERRPGIAVSSIGDAAFFSTFDLRDQRCGSIVAVRLVSVATVSLCGPGFGTSGDTAALNPIARRLLGMR